MSDQDIELIREEDSSNAFETPDSPLSSANPHSYERSSSEAENASSKSERLANDVKTEEKEKGNEPEQMKKEEKVPEEEKNEEETEGLQLDEKEKSDVQDIETLKRFDQFPWWYWLFGWKNYDLKSRDSFLPIFKQLAELFFTICIHVVISSLLLTGGIIASSYLPWQGNVDSVTHYMNSWTCKISFFYFCN